MKAGIALGSNVGDRLANLRAARDRLFGLHQGTAEAFLISPIYETEPVDCEPGTAAFFNAVIELETSLHPLDLLDAAQAIERELGRPDRRPKNAPRTIDVDLLYGEGVEIENERLSLPHPRMQERWFVLQPLSHLRDTLPGTSGPSGDISRLIRHLAGERPKLIQAVW